MCRRNRARKGVGLGTWTTLSRGDLHYGSVQRPLEKLFQRGVSQGRAEEVREAPICEAHQV